MKKVKCCGTCVGFEIGENQYDGIFCNKKDRKQINTFQEPCGMYEEYKHPHAYIIDTIFN